MTRKQLNAWLDETAWDKMYWSDVHLFADAVEADGCTGVADLFVWSCLEHDVFYRTHKFIGGGDITKVQADYILRIRIQQVHMSFLKWPISWIRWFGIAVLFKNVSEKAWRTHGGTRPLV